MDISTKFDILIWFFLLVGLLAQIIIIVIPFVRRSAIGKNVFISIIVCQLLVMYGSFIEPRMITVAHYQVERDALSGLSPSEQDRFFNPQKTPPKPTEALRIAVIADWHLGPYKQAHYVQRVADHLLVLEPSVVLLPGDFIYTGADDAGYLSPLRAVTETIPIYASLGNHDFNWREQFDQRDITTIPDTYRYSQTITDTLESFGIRVLRDETETTEINGRNISFVGQDDWWATERDDVQDIPIQDASDLAILVQHNPDGAFFQTLPSDIDLVVSGHTHGGQIRLPLVGALWPIPTQIGNAVDQGWFTLDDPNQMLYVTHGIGETGPRARMFAWPEIVVFDIFEDTKPGA